MSSSLTAPTSTTASSISCPSRGVRVVPPEGQSPSPTTEIVACGALAGHIREIVARRGWPAAVTPLPAVLHNRPQKIVIEAERAVASALASGRTVALAYADCGTYGVLAELGLDRYPELWDDYFAHYTRLIWLAQEPSPALEAEADRVAGMFGLPLTRVDVGVSRLERALAFLVEAALWPVCASCCPRRGTR